MMAKVCMVGDIFGNAGLDALRNVLPKFIADEKIDFTVVNGENANGGNGILASDADVIFSSGADAITGGNHTFEKRDVFPYLQENRSRCLRPANYPKNAHEIFMRRFGCEGDLMLPGSGFAKFVRNGVTFAVMNLQGRELMPFPVDCPFACADSLLTSCEGAILLVDFHAESFMEKEAMGIFLDGRASVVAGTHTHVQTADEKILPGGTAYISDIGMTGVLDSVIGCEYENSILRNRTQVKYKLRCAEGDAFVCGITVEIDAETRKATSIHRFCIKATNPVRK